MIQRMRLRQILVASVAVCALFLAAQLSLAQTKSGAEPTPATMVEVPFVGCASDGQMGPLKAPKVKNRAFPIPPADAQRLAYYEAENGPGVLAPRGWHCFSTYGSNGSSLFVSSDPIDSEMLFSGKWKGFSGQAIQISFSFGDTSGRFEVAGVIARVFPAYKQFVGDVIAGGIRPASDFPFGPYPHDKLHYCAKNVVEFETPANTEGLGTNSLLQANASAILGVAIIAGGDKDLTQLSVRIPETDRNLLPYIIQQVEREAQAAAQ